MRERAVLLPLIRRNQKKPIRLSYPVLTPYDYEVVSREADIGVPSTELINDPESEVDPKGGKTKP